MLLYEFKVVVNNSITVPVQDSKTWAQQCKDKSSTIWGSARKVEFGGGYCHGSSVELDWFGDSSLDLRLCKPHPSIPKQQDDDDQSWNKVDGVVIIAPPTVC